MFVIIEKVSNCCDIEKSLTWGGDVNVERAQAAGVKAQTLTQHRAPVITYAHAYKYAHTHKQINAF